MAKFTMLDLEAQKLVVDGKLRCWLDIDVNDSRASYQRAVDFVGAKNLTCAFAEIHDRDGLGLWSCALLTESECAFSQIT